MLLITRQPCNGTTPRSDVHSSPPLRRSRRGHCTAHSAAQPCCDNPHTSTVTTRRKCKTTNTQSHTMHSQRILIESSPDNATNLTHIMQVKIDDTIPTQGNRIPTEWTVAIIACVRTEAPNVQYVIHSAMQPKPAYKSNCIAVRSPSNRRGGLT